MARKGIVAAFGTQNQAYDALGAIKRLGDDKVSIKQSVLVSKDAKGSVSFPEWNTNDVPWGGITGPIVGGLLGLIAGPAGMAVGAAGGAAIGATTGLVMGWTADLVHMGMDEDVVHSISTEINPGDTAVVAEIEEGSTEPLDDLVKQYHGRIFHSALWS